MFVNIKGTKTKSHCCRFEPGLEKSGCVVRSVRSEKEIKACIKNAKLRKLIMAIEATTYFCTIKFVIDWEELSLSKAEELVNRLL